MSSIREYWSMTEGAFNCLYDTKRTMAFKRAIKVAVRPGDVVVDAGSGTGIFAANGYGDRIEVIHGDATTLTLPERADVIVCEMIATALIEELQVPVMNNMLRFVNADYRVVLEKYECHAELVRQKNLYHGKRFDIIRYEYPEKPSLRAKILSNRVTYKRVYFAKRTADQTVSAHLGFLIEQDGVINGLRLSATTKFHGGEEFQSSFSYSYPIVLPIDEVAVKTGDTVVVDLSYQLCGGLGGLDYEIASINPGGG